jgi:hypothetical protein
MEKEFKRFGLPNIALFVAFAQLSGSIGLIFGLINPTILIYSSAGLSLLMFFAFFTRLRVKDSLSSSFPALFYLILNLVIFIYSLLDL